MILSSDQMEYSADPFPNLTPGQRRSFKALLTDAQIAATRYDGTQAKLNHLNLCLNRLHEFARPYKKETDPSVEALLDLFVQHSDTTGSRSGSFSDLKEKAFIQSQPKLAPHHPRHFESLLSNLVRIEVEIQTSARPLLNVHEETRNPAYQPRLPVLLACLFEKGIAADQINLKIYPAVTKADTLPSDYMVVGIPGMNAQIALTNTKGHDSFLLLRQETIEYWETETLISLKNDSRVTVLPDSGLDAFYQTLSRSLPAFSQDTASFPVPEAPSLTENEPRDEILTGAQIQARLKEFLKDPRAFMIQAAAEGHITLNSEASMDRRYGPVGTPFHSPRTQRKKSDGLANLAAHVFNMESSLQPPHFEEETDEVIASTALAAPAIVADENDTEIEASPAAILEAPSEKAEAETDPIKDRGNLSLALNHLKIQRRFLAHLPNGTKGTDILKPWIIARISDHRASHSQENPTVQSGEIDGYPGIDWSMVNDAIYANGRHHKINLDQFIESQTAFRAPHVRKPSVHTTTQGPVSRVRKEFQNSADTKRKEREQERKAVIIAEFLAYTALHGYFPSTGRATDTPEEKRLWGKNEQWLNNHMGFGIGEFIRQWTREQDGKYQQKHGGAHAYAFAGDIEGYPGYEWKLLDTAYRAYKKQFTTTLTRVLGETDLDPAQRSGSSRKGNVRAAFARQTFDTMQDREIEIRWPGRYKYVASSTAPANRNDLAGRILAYTQDKNKFPSAHDECENSRTRAYWRDQEEWCLNREGLTLSRFILKWTREKAAEHRKDNHGEQPSTGPIKGHETYSWDFLRTAFYAQPLRPNLEDIIACDPNGYRLDIAKVPLRKERQADPVAPAKTLAKTGDIKNDNDLPLAAFAEAAMPRAKIVEEPDAAAADVSLIIEARVAAVTDNAVHEKPTKAKPYGPRNSLEGRFDRIVHDIIGYAVKHKAWPMRHSDNDSEYPLKLWLAHDQWLYQHGKLTINKCIDNLIHNLAQFHKARTGALPARHSGDIPEAPGLTWELVDDCYLKRPRATTSLDIVLRQGHADYTELVVAEKQRRHAVPQNRL